MEPKRVCAILFNNFTYDSRVLKECRSLARLGYSVTLLAFHDNDLPIEELRDGFKVKRIVAWTRRLPRFRWIAPLKLIEIWVRFFVQVLRLKPHAIHCHELLPLIVAVPGAIVTGARLIYDSHELYTEREGVAGLRKRVYEWIESFSLRHTSLVIMSDGQSRAEVLRHKYKHCPEIHIIYNCPPLPKLDPQDPSALRECLGLPKDGFLVLYVGGVQRNRGLEQAITAIAELPYASLVIMGTVNTVGDELYEQAKKLGCSDRLFFIGPFPPDEVSYYAAACDVGIALIQDSSLSYAYSLPTKVFEYMASGLPVLASDFPEIRRVVSAQPPCGMVVNPSDVKAIREALHWLRNHPEVRSAMGDSGRRSVSERYNWEVQEKTLATLYGCLLANRRAPWKGPSDSELL